MCSSGDSPPLLPAVPRSPRWGRSCPRRRSPFPGRGGHFPGTSCRLRGGIWRPTAARGASSRPRHSEDREGRDRRWDKRRLAVTVESGYEILNFRASNTGWHITFVKTYRWQWCESCVLLWGLWGRFDERDVSPCREIEVVKVIFWVDFLYPRVLQKYSGANLFNRFDKPVLVINF